MLNPSRANAQTNDPTITRCINFANSGFPSVTLEFIDLKNTGTQCAIFADAGTFIYIVFRGSENRIDWDTNFNLEQEVVKFQQDVLQEKVVGDRCAVCGASRRLRHR